MKLFAELRQHSHIWSYRILYAPISLFVTFIYREFYKPVDIFIARLHLIDQPYVGMEGNGMEWKGMEELYLNRVALLARRLVSIGALYLDISYL